MLAYTIIRLGSCIAAALLLVSIAAALRRQSRRHDSVYFVEFLVCIFVLLVCDVGELSCSSDGLILLFSHLSYAAIAFMPVFWFLFAYQYGTGRYSRLWPLSLCLLSLPLATTVIAFFDSRWHLIWLGSEIRDMGGMRVNVVLGYGPWFWLHSAYSYMLFLLGALLMLRELFGHFDLYKRQAGLVLCAVIIPLVGNIVYIFRLVPGQVRDFSPMLLAITGALFTLSIVKYRLLELNPTDNQSVGDYLDEGVIIVNPQGSVLYCNIACLRMLGLQSRDELIGSSIEKLIPIGPYLDSSENVASAFPFTIDLPATGGRPAIEVAAKAIERSDRGEMHYVLTLREPRDWAGEQASGPAAPVKLSARETEIAQLFAQGLTQKEIAARLYVSENTVKTHVRHIYRKTGAATKLELAKLLEKS
jgi:Response regulator containing a CheY-like receiver domain and an HTH DNA-binding domain